MPETELRVLTFWQFADMCYWQDENGEHCGDEDQWNRENKKPACRAESCAEWAKYPRVTVALELEEEDG